MNTTYIMKKTAYIFCASACAFMPKGFAETVTVVDYSGLNDAIQNSNIDTIQLGGDFALEDNLPVINRNLTINGNGKTIDANGHQSFIVNSDNNLSVDNMTIKNGIADNSNGGAIYTNTIKADSTISNNTFIGNQADRGGAIWTDNIEGTISNNTFIGNQANGYEYGGAIYTDWLKAGGTIRNNTFTGNKAATGGAIGAYEIDSGSNISGNTFTENVADMDGGAIYNFDENRKGKTITGNTFIGNKANGTESAGRGGAIWLSVLSGNTTDNTFEKNQAVTNGGAIWVDKIDSDISGCIFTDNQAGKYGGAIYVYTRGGKFTVSAGRSTTFSGNRDSTGLNSICTNASISFNVDGKLYLYDPIYVKSGNIEKNGSGLMLLGGSNTISGDFNINEGTLRLAPDVEGTSFSLNAGSFNLNSGSRLEIIRTNTPAQINAKNDIILNSDIILAPVTDYHYAPKLEIKNWNVVLDLNKPYIGNMTIPYKSGTFALGQYIYNYDNLRWNDRKTELGYELSRVENPEMTGSYSADSYIRTYLVNDTPNKIFDRISSSFKQMKSYEKKLQNNIWATGFHSLSKSDSSGIYAGSTTKVPCVILGIDRPLNENSFFGVAVSAAWPNYRQGSFEDTGLDTRASLYGGALLKNDIELGWLATAGWGHLDGTRRFLGSTFTGKRDMTNYALGVSLSKDFQHKSDTILKPFMTLEYLHSKVDGVRESGDPDYAVGISDLSSNIFRLKTGISYIKNLSPGSYVKGSLFYQGLYGDVQPTGKSSMNAAPEDRAIMRGIGSDKNYLGVGVSYAKELSYTTSVILDYSGLFSNSSKQQNFSLTLETKF